VSNTPTKIETEYNQSIIKAFIKYMGLDRSDKYATLTEKDCAKNSRPLSTVRNVSVIPSRPDSA